MCGIVGYIGKNKKALNVLINGLKHLEYRGYDSSGIAYIKDNSLIIKKTVGRINDLEKIIDNDDYAYIGIGHTRWATHGIVNKVNSHPHKCKHITIVHNGIIENYQELKNKLIDKGYTFKSDTDTEVAAVLLEYLYEKNNDILLSIKEFKQKVSGAYAIALICDKEKDTLYAIKKNSPLIIGLGKDENFIASDVPAIIEYTNKYITLNDGDYAKITKEEVFIFDNDNKQVNYNIKTFEGNASEINKNGFDHFMLKEIYEQPAVVRRMISLNSVPDISRYKQILIVACGSAMHAGLVGKYLLETYVDKPVIVEIASEFRYKKLFIDKNTLVIAISQSGETADTLEAVKVAKKHKCRTLGIINVPESSIAREVDYVIYTEAGSEIAVATTKAYIAQVLVLAKLAYRNCAIKDLKEINNFQISLKKLPVIMEEILSLDKKVKQIAKVLSKQRDIFYIGRGIDYAISMEASLKVKEISYIHSDAYAAGELKHGTISLIEKNTPVIGIVTDQKIASKTISNLKEVKARGANVIYLTTKELDSEGDFYDYKIIIKNINPLLDPILTIIPLQLIAYYVALERGCDIDKPKNLAKSVTVE